MGSIQETATENQKRAREIIKDVQIVEIWRSVNAEARLVGSLRMGLLMKHRDIDFHVYSSSLTIADSFSAISKIAENPAIKHIDYVNLINTDEKCIEWHAWYRDKENKLWQIDMIHILKGSFYDGYFENVADKIKTVLTEETKNVILTLKYETPEDEKIMGIEYYQAVIDNGIRNYKDFCNWREKHPVTGIVEWIP